jgi:hypothetical protein
MKGKNTTLKPPSDDPRVNKRRAQCRKKSQRCRENADRAEQGLSPLKKFKSGALLKPPSDDHRVNKERARVRANGQRRRENAALAAQGLSPLKKLKTEKVSRVVYTGDAKVDKVRETQRLNNRRRKLNDTRRKENKPLFPRGYTREEIDAMDPPLRFY